MSSLWRRSDIGTDIITIIITITEIEIEIKKIDIVINAGVRARMTDTTAEETTRKIDIDGEAIMIISDAQILPLTPDHPLPTIVDGLLPRTKGREVDHRQRIRAGGAGLHPHTVVALEPHLLVNKTIIALDRHHGTNQMDTA